jgi:transcriptional regulator with XRE-family HTH domain
VRKASTGELFSARLKAIRLAKNITITDLAESAGLSRQTIHNYESGEREPTWENVQKIAEAMGVSTEAFRNS